MTPGSRHVVLTLLLAGGMMGACNKAKNTAANTPKVQGEPFALTVEAPAADAAGKDFVAIVRVEPRGIYKINLEYPTRLQIKGPEAASPREAKLTAKQAEKIDEKVILFKPSFRIEGAGEHAFEGAIRFSVCTPKQCELKNEKVKWVAKVTE